MLSQRQWNILKFESIFLTHNYINNPKRINITLKDRYATFLKDDFKCCACYSNNLYDLTIDHIIPITLSGKNYKSNYCTLCSKCNLLKKTNSFIHLIYLTQIRSLNIMYNLIMKNKELSEKIFNQNISKNNNGFLSATDLVKAGNNWRIKNNLTPFNINAWFQTDGVKEFINSLEEQFGQVKISGRGRGHHTWVHPLLFIDIALAISPKLKVEVYTWLYDYLLQYRNNSGDSYKRMCGAIYLRISNKSEFKDCIVETALKIKDACEVSDWQRATQQQLQLRDAIHNNISLLSDVLTDINNAIRIGIKKAVETY